MNTPASSPSLAGGTTPDILQHYLTAGIDIEVIEPFGGAPERYMLRGIDQGKEFPIICQQERQTMEFAAFGVLPVLRPISQLVGANNTASLDLFELLEIATGKPVERIQLAAYGSAEPNEAAKVHVQFYQAGNIMYLGMIEQSGAAMIAGELRTSVDFLRSRHYALPVNGRPLVEGQDFIRKEVASV